MLVKPFDKSELMISNSIRMILPLSDTWLMVEQTQTILSCECMLSSVLHSNNVPCRLWVLGSLGPK